MNTDKKITYAQSLRLLADFYDENPSLKAPTQDLNVFTAHSKEDLAAIAKMLGTFNKEVTKDLYTISRQFGVIKLAFPVLRANVCEKRKVMREVEEWVCPDSLLDFESILEGGKK